MAEEHVLDALHQILDVGTPWSGSRFGFREEEEEEEEKEKGEGGGNQRSVLQRQAHSL